VAAPRLPALAPFVDGEGIGVLFEPGDPADLGRALNALAADRERLRAFRTRARHLAETRYNAEAQAPALAAAWGL
jgi:glycosyltransferase involved in cell wall biosynthesis